VNHAIISGRRDLAILLSDAELESSNWGLKKVTVNFKETSRWAHNLLVDYTEVGNRNAVRVLRLPIAGTLLMKDQRQYVQCLEVQYTVKLKIQLRLVGCLSNSLAGVTRGWRPEAAGKGTFEMFVL